MSQQRADILLVEQGLAESRSQATRLIMAGEVRVGTDHVVQKANERFPPHTPLHVEQRHRYVSRGADKLAPALDRFDLRPDGWIALDVGASTGGFTDLLLQRGAARIYAVDVGYGQLHQRLREDPRVICLERTNARLLDRSIIPEPVDILTADVSFISLRKVLPACAPLLKPAAWVFVLVKPQFEARRHEVGKGGVVRSETVRQRCTREICAFAQSQFNWALQGTIPSPITGPKGNQETVAVFWNAAPNGPLHAETH